MGKPWVFSLGAQIVAGDGNAKRLDEAVARIQSSGGAGAYAALIPAMLDPADIAALALFLAADESCTIVTSE